MRPKEYRESKGQEPDCINFKNQGKALSWFKKEEDKAGVPGMSKHIQPMLNEREKSAPFLFDFILSESAWAIIGNAMVASQ